MGEEIIYITPCGSEVVDNTWESEIRFCSMIDLERKRIAEEKKKQCDLARRLFYKTYGILSTLGIL